MVEVKRYIAIDGKEYTTASECLRHDQEVRASHVAELTDLCAKRINAMSFLEYTGCDFCSEDEVTYVLIEDDRILKIVNDFIDTVDYPQDHLGEDMIGKKVAFWLWNNATQGCLGTREQMLAQFDKALDKLFGMED